MSLSETEVRELLEAIERGDVTLQVDGQTPGQVYAGNVHYRTSHGWQLTVFNDCGEWDYLDSVRAPDGREAQYPSEYPSGLDPMEEVHHLFIAYVPPDDAILERYHWGDGGRIDGYYGHESQDAVDEGR